MFLIAILLSFFSSSLALPQPTSINLKIFNGSEAIPHSHPYQAALNIPTPGGWTLCGGALITTRHVLTSASCVQQRSLNQIEVVLGSHVLFTDEGTKVRMNSSNIIIHEDWNDFTHEADIAIVELPLSVYSEDFIESIGLTEEDDNLVGANATFSGWGTQGGITGYSHNLMDLDSVILSNVECKSIPPFETIILDSHLCISGQNNRGLCPGDFGGPLVVNKTLVGIASFGYKFCDQGKPSVFQRISTYSSWIKEHAKIQ